MVDFHDRIRKTLTIDPQAPAIEYRQRWTSWGELARTVEGIDAALEAVGAAPTAPVGAVLRNTPNHAALILSLVASDRCLVTLNPFYPDETLAEDIRNLRPPVIVASAEDWRRQALLEVAREVGAACIQLADHPDSEVSLLPGLESITGSEHFAPEPDVLIYMLTSGTTGLPKRIPLTRPRVLKTLEGALRYERNRQLDTPPSLRKSVMLHMNAMVHIAGLWGLINGVMGGFRICMLDKFDVTEFRRAVAAHQLKVAGVPPSGVLMLLESDATKEELSSLIAIRSGTAPTSPDTIDAVMKRWDIPLLTNYGSTEFTGVAGWSIDEFREHWDSRRGSVGRVHNDYDARVIDPETGEELPAGTEGVLELRGDFVWDGEWVRTTDLAKLDEDRFLWITGRTDNAINRGGFKVHGEEIGQILEQHGDVREVCVVGIQDKRLGAVPAAAVVLREGASLTSDELGAWAREHMLPYQVPAEFRFVDDLPRTPSMKPKLVAIRSLFGSNRPAGEA
tara:strand:+ start:2254 stop:3774 length:1521 start_codon:yes stop_codon:yes gene_type:complete